MKNIFTSLAVFLLGMVVPFWIVIPYVLVRINTAISLPEVSNPFLQLLGWLMLLAGLAISLNTAVQFGSQGKGTPAPFAPPKKLVTGGMYQYSRHPMYIGYLLAFLGEFFITGAVLVLAYLGVVWLILITFINVYEEPELLKMYGKQYQDYMKKVPRWGV